MIWSLATEDELSEAVALRLLAENDIVPFQKLRKGGNGYLRSRRENWRNLARLHPVLLLADLDRVKCAGFMKTDWFGEEGLEPNLCFCIAVHEVEAWLLADHEAMADQFGTKMKKLNAPENHADPKQYLLQQATKFSRRLRDDFVREENGVLKQGLGYNLRLCRFVKDHWAPERAAQYAPSLARARDRIASLAGRQ